MSENALLERCHSGDAAAWDTLFHRYAKSLYNYAFSLCHNYEEANDIVGLVFLRLYKQLDSYRKQASFRTWLFTIAHNTFLDQCVRPARRKNLSLDDSLSSENESFVGNTLIDPAPSPEALCMRKETARMLASAIQELPLNQRQTFRMYYTEGRSYEEIAEVTSVSLGTVKSRLNRARTVLRERLTPYQDTLALA